MEPRMPSRQKDDFAIVIPDDHSNTGFTSIIDNGAINVNLKPSFWWSLPNLDLCSRSSRTESSILALVHPSGGASQV